MFASQFTVKKKKMIKMKMRNIDDKTVILVEMFPLDIRSLILHFTDKLVVDCFRSMEPALGFMTVGTVHNSGPLERRSAGLVLCGKD